MMSSLPRRRAFSLVELLVVIAIAVILLSIFVPYALKMRESDRRARCSNNLRALGLALTAYADQNRQDYPRVRYDPKRAGYVAFTGADAPDPFGGASASGSQVQPNDVTASLWLVVRYGLVGPDRLVCPSSGDTPDPLATNGREAPAPQRSNFSGPRHLSYSYWDPFAPAFKFKASYAASAGTKFGLKDYLPADFAVVADRNPGKSAKSGGPDVTGSAFNDPPFKLARANSANHDRAGQNVLYADGHVQFQATPYCGFGQDWRRDNIYTAYAATPLVPAPPSSSPATQPATAPAAPTPAPIALEARGVFSRTVGPAWENDSYLVPAEGEGSGNAE
jgi:prepilin-type N-terminal cleavage/methylation domain-containing protein/prepilin-type processing-associated H-X9-DG protein